MINPVSRVVRYIRREGFRAFTVTALQRSASRLATAVPAERHKIRMLVRYDDALRVDWSRPAPWQENPRAQGTGPISTAWIMHPPGESSGGHQNIFRFIKYLEDAGHEATVYLYHSHEHGIDAKYLQALVRDSASYPTVRAKFSEYDPAKGVDPRHDAIFATGWETAYPVYLDPSDARRFYFVQDYEPAFYPVGSEHVFAENTYRFGFHGITAGPWLAGRLHDEYGMAADYFAFGADVRHYSYVNTERRKDVFFYARPVTTRRGFEIGVMALELIARERPDLTLHLAGWDVSSYDLPFSYVNHEVMKVTELNELYNRCGAALVLSLTNLSLLPLELLAAGVIPVVNDAPNNTLVSNNPFIEYSEPTPHALARRVLDVLDREDQAEHARAASASTASANWDVSGQQFVSIVERELRG
ncbi:glycosyltransferase family 1 protein [Sanguibacter sp. 25GB23B1]|uniref:rhamnosyltransferase WsaF family glycosyltransferase n=1 Tax=unclassified Sanguibacter TaxID=2645534 RepID=UPI0032AF5503